MQHEYVFAFKQARRREDDIAIVNTGMKALLEKETNSGTWQIKDCSFSFGGMAPTTVMAMKTIKGLTGRYGLSTTMRWMVQPIRRVENHCIHGRILRGVCNRDKKI